MPRRREVDLNRRQLSALAMSVREGGARKASAHGSTWASLEKRGLVIFYDGRFVATIDGRDEIVSRYLDALYSRP